MFIEFEAIVDTMMIADDWSEKVNNNISIPQVTNVPRSYFESQNDVIGGGDLLEDDYEWLLNSTSRNASHCYINITVLHEYIQSKLFESYCLL